MARPRFVVSATGDRISLALICINAPPRRCPSACPGPRTRGRDVRIMNYVDPACAYCPATVRACRAGEAESKGPGFCPSKVDPETQATARACYDEPDTDRKSTRL